MPTWALLTHHFLLLSSFLQLILLWLTRKGLNHSACLPLGYPTKGKKMLSEHLPENLPPLPGGHIACSGVLALNAASLQLTQTLLHPSNALFNFHPLPPMLPPSEKGVLVCLYSSALYKCPSPGAWQPLEVLSPMAQTAPRRTELHLGHPKASQASPSCAPLYLPLCRHAAAFLPKQTTFFSGFC